MDVYKGRVHSGCYESVDNVFLSPSMQQKLVASVRLQGSVCARTTTLDIYATELRVSATGQI